MTDSLPRRLAAASLVLLITAAPGLRAQNGLPLLDDASLVPRGLLRLRTPVVWTRYDQRFTQSGVTGIGAAFTSDALGASQLAPLSIADSLIEAMAASPFSLSLGKSRLNAMVREEHVPFVLEYGVLSRLSFSVTVPVIRKRLSGLLLLDSSGANVGPNPQRLSAAAASNNAIVQAQFVAAAQQLQVKLAACGSNPAGAGCAALLPRQAEALALIASSTTFAQAASTLYGATGSSGQAFVPSASSAAQASIAARVGTFNLQYKDLLAQTADLLTTIPAGAAGPAGSANLASYVESELGRDSLRSDRVLGVGDVEIGMKYLVVNRPSDVGPGFRLLVASSVSLPSGTRRAPVAVADLRIANGAVGFDLRGIAEWRLGRAGLTATGSATSLGKNSVMPAYDSRIVTTAVEPRWHVTGPLELHGSWALRVGDLSGNAQFAGGGVSFSTVGSYKRGDRPLPMEMRFTHLEAVSGTAGVERLTRDQVEVRLYYSLGRH